MDVGNIISIIIPESPDTNINIDQLTSDFKRQLERIRKQSRVNKLEHGLVTLKNVLPEMSKEEKKKTLPLIRRVLQTRRVMNSTKESQPKKNQRNQPTRRSPQPKNNGKTKKPANKSKRPSENRRNNGKQGTRKQKPKKNPKPPEITTDNNDNDYFYVKEMNTDMNFERSWEKSDINRPNRRAQFPCSETTDDEYKVRNTKEIRDFDGPRKNIIKIDEPKGVVSYPMDAGDVIDFDEMKGYERILVTEETPVINSTEENTVFKGKSEETEFEEVSVVNVPFPAGLEAIPRMGRQFVNVNDQNIEIRMQRSVDDNFLGRKVTRRPIPYRPRSKKRGEKGRKKKKSKGQGRGSKKPWKGYPGPLNKTFGDKKAF
uniref:Uncharacterized protein n=1 Tax=Bracon brevicornis TaxID=1563983 RepID=A0A6V7M371_9HYME